jgi:hypothetical protein
VLRVQNVVPADELAPLEIPVSLMSDEHQREALRVALAVLENRAVVDADAVEAAAAVSMNPDMSAAKDPMM